MKQHAGKHVAVIGGGLGGLSAALHLRKAGCEVTIYEKNARVGGRANQLVVEGFTFDTGPSLINYPWVFTELFAAMGRRLEDYVTLQAVEPSITYRWEGGARFQLSSNLAQLRAEVERLEPGAAAGLMAFLADAERKYNFSFNKLVRRNVDNPIAWGLRLTLAEMRATGVWRSLYGELRRFFRSPHLCEALGSYAMYLGGSPWNLPGLFSILPYGELAYGLWFPRGGVYGLVQGIDRLCRELGVRIETGAQVEHILTDKGRACGLRFADGRTVAHPLVVSNVDLPVTRAELLDTPALRNAGARRNRRVKMTPGVITFYWGVRGRISGLGHHTIFLPRNSRESFRDLLDRQQVPRELPFYLCQSSAADPALAPPEHSTLFALAPAPLLSALPGADWSAIAAGARKQIMDRLEREGIRMAAGQLVVERVYTPREWQSEFGLYDGSAFGAAHTLFQMGPFRDRNYEARVGGLYYVGAGTTPGTGLPMVTLGGQMTAERLLARESAD